MGLNVVDQLEFYGSYHHNKWNKLIHFVFVPLLVLTAEIMLCYSGPLISTKPVHNLIPCNLAFFVFCIYAAIYLYIDLIGAISANCLLLACLVCANLIYKTFQVVAWKYAIALHVFSWIAQILSHKYFEGRAPALKDSFFQSLVLAPLFVCVEIGFSFGLRKSLQRELEPRIISKIAEYRKEKRKGN